jgi:hypothetical protein
MNNVTRSIAEDLTKRNTSLSKVLAVGEVSPETAKELEGLNISIEEVAQ